MKKRIFNCTLRNSVLLISCLLLLTSPIHAKSTEDIFERAKNYTIQIRTAVDIPFSSDEKEASQGAGFLVDKKRGWAVTNAHVVTRSISTITVAPHQGKFLAAKKIYVDPYIDMAVIEIPDEHLSKLKEAKLDCANKPKIGHPVGAFGHPWGLAYTGTRGIISGRTSKYDSEFIQTDAPINGGNSGGPLISLKTNKVLAINTASISSEEDQNTNFATPSEYVCKILTLLKEGKDPSPPNLKTIFSETLNDSEKLVVAKTYLHPKQLDLRAGDVITSVNANQTSIKNEGQLIHHLRGNTENIILNVLRDGEQKQITGKLDLAENVLNRKAIHVSGIVLREKNIRDIEELGPENRIFTTYVDPSSIGKSLEIEEWDVIESINGESVSTLNQVNSLLSKTKNQTAQIVIRRWSSKDDRVYDYLIRDLPVKNLLMINNEFKKILGSTYKNK